MLAPLDSTVYTTIVFTQNGFEVDEPPNSNHFVISQTLEIKLYYCSNRGPHGEIKLSRWNAEIRVFVKFKFLCLLQYWSGLDYGLSFIFAQIV